MQISEVRISKVRLKLRSIFTTALGSEEFTENVLIALIDKRGDIGFGESCPNMRITGENCETVIQFIKFVENELKGLNIFETNRIWKVLDRYPGFSSAKCCIDLAIYDLICKYFDLPFWKYLGTENPEVKTDITVSLGKPEDMAREAKEYANQGFRMLKIKLGGPAELDIERSSKIIENIDQDIVFRIDVNQAWTLRDAFKILPYLEKWNIEIIEQPFPYWDLLSHKAFKEKCRIPIILDESIHTPNDIIKAFMFNCCNGVNIKLMKCGGITKAVEIVKLCRYLGFEIMIGCMIETKLSITAAASLASAFNIKYVDLDSPLLIDERECPIKGGIEYEKDVIKLPNKPGFGIYINESIFKS